MFPYDSGIDKKEEKCGLVFSERLLSFLVVADCRGRRRVVKGRVPTNSLSRTNRIMDHDFLIYMDS